MYFRNVLGAECQCKHANTFTMTMLTCCFSIFQIITTLVAFSVKTKIAIEKTILSTNCETHQRYNISQNNVILFTISCSPWPKYWADDGARWKSLMGTWICVQNGMDRSSNTCQDISLKTTNVSLMVVFGESVRYSIKTIDICTKCQRNSSKSCWDASVVDPQTNTVIACLTILH